MKNYLNFIDISAYQKGLDLSAVFSGNDLDGVIVKATGGTSYVQNTCDPWVQWLIKNGKPWGFYHFLDDDHKHSSGKAEAEFFVKNCKNYFGHGLPCADYEEPATLLGTEYLLEFLETVYELTGVKCAVYSNLYTVQSQDFSKIAAAGYPLWLAQYADFKPRTFADTPWQKGSFAPFDRITMHQYSSSGKLNGFANAVDIDRFYGTVEDWERLVANAEPDKTEYVTVQIEKNLYEQIRKLFM